MALYRVHFDKIVHNRKKGTYTCSPSLHVVNVSDYSVSLARDYAEAAFSKRPELRGEVSHYRVFELEPHFIRGSMRLIAKLFCSGNDSSGCRRFWE